LYSGVALSCARASHSENTQIMGVDCTFTADTLRCAWCVAWATTHRVRPGLLVCAAFHQQAQARLVAKESGYVEWR
jgi:hypothetical protein